MSRKRPHTSSQFFYSLFSLVVILLSSTFSVSGQEKINEELMPDIEWGEGSIMLNDGTEIKGLIRYNDKNGLVSYERGNDNRSFTARSIMGFEFFDHVLQRQRVFYTIQHDDGKATGKRPLLFEVLKDFKDFSVLSKMNPVEIKQKQNQHTVWNGTTNITVDGGTTTHINHTETVYILDETGELKPYLEITRKVVDRLWYDRTRMKSKVIDEDVFKSHFTEPGYSKMLQYAKAENLEFTIKEDLLKILEYYKGLED